MNRHSLLAGLALVAAVACDRPAPSAAHQSLSSLDQLRSAFNADSGKVRAIFLASPT
jgi:hypothetical protein